MSFCDHASQVPVAAAVYHEDMYVNFKLSTETASKIAGIRLWITNEFMHSGLRDDGNKVLDHLFGMLNGKKPLFWSPLQLFWCLKLASHSILNFYFLLYMLKYLPGLALVVNYDLLFLVTNCFRKSSNTFRENKYF